MQLSCLLAIAGLAAAATTSPSAAPAPAPYTGGDTSGCGKTHLFNGLPTARTLLSGGKQRRYLAHLPTTYDPHHPHPVIVGFHGSSSIGFFFEADTGLDLPRYTADKITVYPDGLGGAWAGANYSVATVAEDLRFVRDLLADLRANFCVDSARVYATGMSSGGGFVDTIACDAEVGGEFAAFAPASGAFYTNNDENGRECRPARVPMPILEFHGGADESVRYEGGEGEGGVEPSIPNWLQRWAERNGCDSPHKQEDLYGGGVHHLSWTCKGQEGVLQHYKTDDQKHDWPSPWPNFSQLAALDKPTHLEASAIIQEFFMRFTRPEE
ncbi:carbohydrate esterase family 1 protein [Cordyceps fumosorosea ARSEF 2679]|uniref:feruloyl esterase n=1 Tax=Cordyceps fumosorosea (strain ARSEF 2679) TaxID=1081104 RepID=A0A168BBI1_CORFA|nr:carbohydrate esterase family 1 protein [Cordyceps fumosorosea ARSEF 2679]OAA69890.1 carbohydrate esterase family 1 protein [Cordyceps fumosorosea ARSEF 2679]